MKGQGEWDDPILWFTPQCPPGENWAWPKPQTGRARPRVLESPPLPQGSVKALTPCTLNWDTNFLINFLTDRPNA